MAFGSATAALGGLAVGALLLAGCANREAGMGENGPVSEVATATTGAAAQITNILAQPLPQASGSPSPSPITLPSQRTRDTLTVWLLPDIPESVVRLVNQRFATTYPKVTVNVMRQDWATLEGQAQAKLPLRAETPDVVETAAADTAGWYAEGLLANLEPVRNDLRSSEWTPGLAHSTEVDGVPVAVPAYGFGRVVAYDKAAWEAAGVGDPPKTLTQFGDSLAKVQSGGMAADYSAFWFPGRFWTGALPWIWTYGGELAVPQNGVWQGAVDSGESQAGLLALQDIVRRYSKAPAEADETTASAVRAYDDGRAGSALMTPSEVGSLTKKADVFALPGEAAGHAAPQYLDGSNLSVSASSGQQGLAVAWLQRFLDEQVQQEIVRTTHAIPGMEKSVSLLTKVKGDPVAPLQAQLAHTGRFTPPVPQWLQVEEEKVMPDMTQAIFTPVVSAAPSGSAVAPSGESLPSGSPTASVPASQLPSLSPQGSTG